MARTFDPVRLLAGAAASFLAGGLFVIAPAAAAVPVISFVEECPVGGGDPPPTPGPNCTPKQDTVVRGKRAIVFSVDAGQFNRVRRVDVFILATEEGIASPGTPPGSAVRTWEWSDVASAPRNTGTLRYTWDSDKLTPDNGIYKIRVTAATHPPDSSNAASERADLSVDNLPSTPKQPIILAASRDGVSLDWSSAPESDFLSFTVWRARTNTPGAEPADDAFVPIGVTQNTDAFDEIGESGAYWYKVQSTRRSAVTPETGISSELSARTSEPGEVVIPTPTPPPGSGGTGGPRRTREPDPRAIIGPALTPRPLGIRSLRAPPVPDAPFSQYLPFDLPDEEGGELPRALDEIDEGFDEDDQGAVSAVAIGFFLVSAALVVGRAPA